MAVVGLQEDQPDQLIGFSAKGEQSQGDLKMLARAPKLLLRVRIGNGEATDAVAGFAFVALFLYARALGTQSAARFGSVEAQLQRSVQQIGKNITGRVYLFVVLSAFRVQGGEVQVGAVLGALIGR